MSLHITYNENAPSAAERVCDQCGARSQVFDNSSRPVGWSTYTAPREDLYIKDGPDAFAPMPEGWAGKRYLYRYILLLDRCLDCSLKEVQR